MSNQALVDRLTSKISAGAGGKLPKSLIVAAYADDEVVIVPCDRTLIKGSAVVRRMVVTVSSHVLDGVKTYDGSAPPYDATGRGGVNVILFQEQITHFVPGYLGSVTDFLEHVRFAERYSLNVKWICKQFDRTCWLHEWRDRYGDVWRDCKLVTTPMEATWFDTPKLGVVAPAQAYPVGVTTAATIGQINAVAPISTPDLVELVDILRRNGATDLVNKMLVVLTTSIEHCPFTFALARYSEFPWYKSALRCTMRVMFLEELAMYKRQVAHPRIILDLDTIASLPTYPCAYAESPYYPVLARVVRRFTLPAYLDGERGVYSTKVFAHRLDIFTGGALAKIKWTRQGPNGVAKTAVSGSAITACALRSPLERKFGAYLAEFYPSRDPAASIAKPAVETVQTREYTFIELDESAESSSSSSADDSTSSSASAGDVPRALNPPHSNGYSDVDLMIECPWEDFDEHAQAHFQAIKAVYPSAELTYVQTENKHKYIVVGPHRDIDIFHVADIPSVIVKYHSACVRAWYDGTTVHCFPTFVTAAMTGISTDIRWTSNRKDVRDIVMKYFQRGFGQLLNKTDCAVMTSYIDGGNGWPRRMVPHNGWQARKYDKSPAYFDELDAIFNPSQSRIGIHANIPTRPQQYSVPLTNKFRPSKKAHMDPPKLSKDLAPYL